MQTIIDNAIEQINQGADWIIKNAKVDKKKSYKVLTKERRTLKKIKNATDNNTAVVLYGQSQCGKSHLASSLLSEDGKAMLVQDRMNSTTHEFLTDLNPKGSGEATGIITRFTLKAQDNISKEFPVHIKLMSLKDIVLMLCDGYYRDLVNRVPFQTDEILQLLEELRSRSISTQRNHFITEDDICDIEDYFKNCNISQDLYYALSANSTDYFGELSLIIEHLGEDDIIRSLCMFWNNDKVLSNTFIQLFKACDCLDFASDAYISFEDLYNSNKTLLYVNWLDLDDLTTMSRVCYKNSKGELQEANIAKAYLASICAEVVLEIVPPQAGSSEKAGYLRSIMEKVDILDFPGARARGGIISSSGHMDIILRRGKVGYYFNKYSSERVISSLLFCWEPDNFEAKPMESVLRNWIDVAIGRDPKERSAYMEGMAVPPLFFVGTKFNMHLQSQTDDKPGNTNALNTRWKKWFDEQLAKDIVGVPNGPSQNDNYMWFESWTEHEEKFNNCYLLRDFRYSTNIYEGWTEQTCKEGKRLPEKYEGFYRELRDSFVNYPFVKNHFKNAASLWDEASESNCDGSLPIARNLALIVGKIADAAKAKNLRDISESVSNIVIELKKHYYSTDTEEALKKALGSAARLQASLDIAFGRDPYYFGRFMKAVTITEYAVHEVFSDVFSKVYEAGNIGDYVYIYMRAPDLKPGNSFDENLQILRMAYGFSNEDECRQYFEGNLKIDLEDLFRRSEFGLQSPSQMLAATLKTYWFDGWLRGSQREALCKMLDEGSFEEMVDMLHSLFVKYDVERRVAQTIHRYVDTFGVDVKELSEMIADICAEMINKFVLTVGYDYYSQEEGVVENLKEATSKHQIELNFHFVEAEAQQASNSHIASVMAEMDDMERTRLMLMQPDGQSIDDLSAVIPGFRQSCRWRDLAKVGFVLTNDIPHYDVEANDRLGRIIEKCRTLNNK